MPDAGSEVLRPRDRRDASAARPSCPFLLVDLGIPLWGRVELKDPYELIGQVGEVLLTPGGLSWCALASLRTSDSPLSATVTTWRLW